MKQHIVKVQLAEKITHDVVRMVTDKPHRYSFMPGQATEVAINKSGWREKKNPFTFTSIPENDYLEFTIKTYPAREGVTNELLQIRKNDEFILHEVFGAINYQGAGVFIAGGAGVTPFISILRHLQSKNEMGNNRLLFANKKKADIILREEFESMLGDNFINILSDENVAGYANGRITADFIKAKSGGVNKLFYVCGPPPMMDAIEEQLAELHVDEQSIIKESF